MPTTTSSAPAPPAFDPSLSPPSVPPDGDGQNTATVDRERHRLVERIAHGAEMPMMVLGFVWLILLIVDQIRGLSPAMAFVGQVIWFLFIVHFMLEFAIAPSKKTYLRKHWVTAVALFIPALRVLRFARVLRLAGEWEVVGVLGGVHSAIDTLGRITGRRGLVYAALLTIAVTVLGAAGIFALEHDVTGSGVTDFWSAIWWTGMAMLTMGTDYLPKTPQGRLLCVVLAAYGLSVFGYVTAAIASVFVAQDAEDGDDDKSAAVHGRLQSIESELTALRAEIRSLTSSLRNDRP